MKHASHLKVVCVPDSNLNWRGRVPDDLLRRAETVAVIPLPVMNL